MKTFKKFLEVQHRDPQAVGWNVKAWKDGKVVAFVRVSATTKALAKQAAKKQNPELLGVSWTAAKASGFA